MGRRALAPGHRFHPTDVELVMYFLKRKVMGKPLRSEDIRELDLYKFDPWDLPGKSCSQSGDLEWFFFCPRDRKYANGSRINRATETGYWKTTGKDRAVIHNSEKVAMKKTLVFHVGRAPRGDRTDWVMHEFRLEEKGLADQGIFQESYVLCRIVQKSGPGPKNGEQYGAPFREEDWDDDVIDNTEESAAVVDQGSPPLMLDDHQNISSMKCVPVPESMGYTSVVPLPCQLVTSYAGHGNPPLPEEDDIISMLDIFKDADTLVSNNHDEKSKLDLPGEGSTVEPTTISDDEYKIFGGLEDLNTQAEFNTKSRFHFHNMVAAEHSLDQSLVGDDNDMSYLELNDLKYPLEFEEASVFKSSNMDGFNKPICPFESILPACVERGCPMLPERSAVCPEGSSFGGNSDCSHISGAKAASGEGNAPKTMAKGESQASYSRLQYILGSIPARPASAAEYPFSLPWRE